MYSSKYITGNIIHSNFKYFIRIQILNISKTRTIPLHPESDGMVEPFNRSLEEYLKRSKDMRENYSLIFTCISNSST